MKRKITIASLVDKPCNVYENIDILVTLLTVNLKSL